MQILTNLCLLVTGFFLFWLQRLLYGPLRPIETEQLYEKAWFAVTETCLAMTIFRGELGGWFLVMFVSLLVGKVWGWIGEGRVEFVEQQPPSNPRLFHTRLAASLLLSVLFNAYMLQYCVTTVLEQARPDMMVMFGFEFAILTILSGSTAARYAISLVEILITHQQTKAKIEENRAEIRAAREAIIRRHEQSGESGSPANLPDESDVNELELDVPGWEEKGRWVFYLDLATDFLKLTVYLTFFAILFTFYGLPIHILRDVVVTIRSFCRRIIDFMRYRNATRDMNERYPDATVEEVTREEVCIICREEMTSWQQPANAPGAARPRRIPERLRPKKLPCGHILHFSCLRSWLERQQNCPTCRRPVVAPRNPPFRGDAARGNMGGGQQNILDGHQGPDRNDPQRDGLARARVFQFGPFRFGFGAGRGDLFHNIHNQIHNGGNVPLQQPGNANHPGARQIGFGFGFGRPQQAPGPAAVAQPAPTPTFNTANIQTQLQQMEQHITQEINNLRVTAEQLHLVRLLQTELQRLRIQANMAGTQGPLFPVATPTATFPPSSTSSVAMRRQFMSDPRAPALGAGDPGLPEGLSLPQGWTLIPLHSAAQGPSQPPAPSTAPTTTETSTQPQSSGTEATQTVQETVTNGNQTGANGATETPNHLAGENLPDWQTQTAAPTTVHRTEASSQNWTTATADKPAEETGGPSISPRDSQNDAEQPNGNESVSSSSKGKGRVATVEDAEDEDV